MERYAAIFLRPKDNLDGADGISIEVQIGNGVTSIPNLDVTRYVAGQVDPPQRGDILVAVRHEYKIYPADTMIS